MQSVSKGRNGLGSIYVWAAGNDGSAGDNCNYDGYANQRFVILVGASDADGNPGSYSEPCAALFGLAPGGTVGGNRIMTTDLMGSNGLDTVRPLLSPPSSHLPFISLPALRLRGLCRHLCGLPPGLGPGGADPRGESLPHGP